MKKQILISLFILALPIGMYAQNDDMYFTPKKSDKTVKAVEEEISDRSVYYVGSSRDVDEYNRRGHFRSNYQKLSGDSIGNDIIDFDLEKGVYPDSSYVDTTFVYGKAYQFDDEDGDYTYSRRMYRFDDFYDPWFYGWYGRSPYWYGGYYGWYDPWYSPWYGGYYGWYDPWYYSSWYGPYYGGYYGWGWPYRSWYGYYGGWYGYYGGYYGGWGYPHGYTVSSSPTHRSHFGGTGGGTARSSWARTGGQHNSSFGTSSVRRSSPSSSYSRSSSSYDTTTSSRPRSSFSDRSNSSFGNTSTPTRSYSPSSSSSGSFGGGYSGGGGSFGGGGGGRSSGGGSFGGHR